jgi:tetrahydromethanopterin S-methyltransferase subunit B
MGLVLLLYVLPSVVVGLIIGLVISVVLDRIVRESCRSLRLKYATIVSSKARSLLTVSEIFLTSFLAISMWYFSWPIFSDYLDTSLIDSIPEALSGMDKWNAAINLYMRAFFVYGFVLGLIPGLTAIICFYTVRKIALAKVKPVSRS